MKIRTFLTIASQRSTVSRAIKIALVVGIILVAINEGRALMSGNFSAGVLIGAGMNFVVPYCVSTVSTVLAHGESNKKESS